MYAGNVMPCKPSHVISSYLVRNRNSSYDILHVCMDSRLEWAVDACMLYGSYIVHVAMVGRVGWEICKKLQKNCGVYDTESRR